MDVSALEAVVYDPSKCSKLSMEQKRELVYEVSKWPDSASEMLKVWSRQEILQILCVELGKERKYTGLTKSKIIEQLLKLVCERKSQELGTASVSQTQPSLENGERTPKRQRKSDQPNRLLVTATSTSDLDPVNAVHCKNSACKAKMNSKDTFCKRCSCCICRQYDDNKDPSLWLTCNSEPPFLGVSCGMSCHLECALRHENSGISQDRPDKGLDGSFCCVSCGKVNDLLSSWRKQLVVARDTRRVDILCYRLSLAQKTLAGTKHYQNLYGIIDEAVRMLEKEVGHLTGLPVKKARGIVNRLSSGPEIQRLCASATEALDSMLANRALDMPSGWNTLGTDLIGFEDIHDTSVTIILNFDGSNMANVVSYSLWHRVAGDAHYPTDPTCRLFVSNNKFLLSGLTPATLYFLKVVAHDTDKEMGFCEFQFHTGNLQQEMQLMNSSSLEAERSESPATNCSSLSNPSSVEDETNNINPDKATTPNENIGNCSDPIRKDTTGNAIISLLDEECSMDKNKESSNGEETSTDNGSNTPLRTGLECVPYMDNSEAGLPITPCKFENMKEGTRPKQLTLHAGTKREGKKRCEEIQGKECAIGGIGDKEFEYYVKVIRWLECEGHLETGFRQKFLTWYSLRANPQEVRIVKVFIDTFIEDPESLAGQLVDSFSDAVSNKRCSTVPAGFCTKFWH